ncbi:methyl-accepting chemotaxis protein [Noviherbaspirillum aerium]|uniref:methyl-accepting chemotaxis protein n=1 Tax=Noviherbaspirillum aerium TaxID=2588497 RepID=UPI00124C20B5|nr:methyl-accepting chemotaxis protein [Noviherbaspirillum aerium]
MKKLDIGAKLTLAFGFLLLLFVALACISGNRMAKINDSLISVTKGSNVIAHELNEMRQSVMTMSASVTAMVLVMDEQQMLSEASRVERAVSRYRASLAAIKPKLAGTPAEKSLIAVQSLAEKTTPVVEKTMAIAMKQGDIGVVLKELLSHQRLWIDAIETLQKEQGAETERITQNASTVYQQALAAMVIFCGMAIAIGACTACFITRSVTRPLQQAASFAESVAEGNLAATVEVTSTDETGRLMHALNAMNASLRHIVGKVQESTQSIAMASTGIAAGNLDLSKRTDEQSLALQSTISAIEALDRTVKQNAEDAAVARRLAGSAREIAGEGGTLVSVVMETMDGINASSRRISEITNVIDDIAFQTNILALNASVEAARAGIQGRGFAIVASEVRALAHRAETAAKEIKDLISKSVEQVDTGSRLVADAGVTIGQVVSSVSEVATLISDIAKACQNQANDIDTISGSAKTMDHVTQQNAALVEEAAAASCSLQNQAGNLSQLLMMFQLKRESCGASGKVIPQHPNRHPGGKRTMAKISNAGKRKQQYLRLDSA